MVHSSFSIAYCAICFRRPLIRLFGRPSESLRPATSLDEVSGAIPNSPLEWNEMNRLVSIRRGGDGPEPQPSRELTISAKRKWKRYEDIFIHSECFVD